MRILEASIFRRFSGLKIVAISAAIGVCATLPLLLYVVLGPEDGNPIGLGFLAVVCVPIAVIGMGIGFVTFAVQWLTRRG